MAECKIITERTLALESRRRDAITNKKDKLQQKLALEVCILSFLQVCIKSPRLRFFSLFPSINVLLVFKVIMIELHRYQYSLQKSSQFPSYHPNYRSEK